MSRLFPLCLLLVLCASTAHGFESDQLTRRGQPLADVQEAADRYAADLLRTAAARTNDRLQCGADRATTHRVLARQVFQAMGRSTWVPARGELPQMEFGAYSAWLEDGPLERRSFVRRDDLYSQVRPEERPILALWGPASTVRLGDVLVGTDKIDHFWVQGFLYWRRSHHGADEERAVAWGTRTELRIWGQATTGVFSWGDLAANHRGYEFYSGLLDAGSPLQLDAAGCVTVGGTFRWEEWVDWRFDEVLNPSSYRPHLLDDLAAYLDRNQARICAELPLWRGEDSERAVLDDAEAYASDDAPLRADPFDLDALCAGVSSESGHLEEFWDDGRPPPWRIARRERVPPLRPRRIR